MIIITCVYIYDIVTFLSADFWQKPAMKKFVKNLSFGVDVKL